MLEFLKVAENWVGRALITSMPSCQTECNKVNIGQYSARIHHWANRSNARGLALEYQNTPLLVFHVFRLFTTRQTWWAFWLLRVVYRLRKLTTWPIFVFEWLKRIEPKASCFATQELDRNQCIHGAPPKFCQGGGNVEILLSFSGCWRCNANGRSQIALHFPPHLSVLVEPQFSIFCLKCFLHFCYQKYFFFS